MVNEEKVKKIIIKKLRQHSFLHCHAQGKPKCASRVLAHKHALGGGGLRRRSGEGGKKKVAKKKNTRKMEEQEEVYVKKKGNVH